ncbi:hypothetical protein VTN96DRAFT_1209 [Rasamsonia emersonii]
MSLLLAYALRPFVVRRVGSWTASTRSAARLRPALNKSLLGRIPRHQAVPTRAKRVKLGMLRPKGGDGGLQRSRHGLPARPIGQLQEPWQRPPGPPSL